LNALKHISFAEIADQACALYNEEHDELLLGMFGQEYVVKHDGVLLRGQKAPDAHADVVIGYLQASGVKPVLTPWRSIRDFSEVPIPEFRETVEMPLLHAARDIISRANVLLPMVEASVSSSLVNSDLAFTVRALPNVYLHVELSRESQEFPAEAWVLYSNNAAAFLTVQKLLTLAVLFKDRLLGLARIY